jgi:TRAP-type mannitol/chloroaromatic compound transport system permease large subunit
MADPAEQAEHAISALMRFVVSLIIPVWALAMLALGVEYRSIWWLGCGLAVGAVGLLLLVGNPLAGPVLDMRESWRPVSPPKPAVDEKPAEAAQH